MLRLSRQRLVFLTLALLLHLPAAHATPEIADESEAPPVGVMPAPAAPGPAPAPGAGPAVQAAAAILVDARTGAVLWEKNANERRPMASTTKIMTATLLLERTQPDEMIMPSKKAAATPYANLNMQLGEQIAMGDMLYAIMLRSSNDGCVAAAEHVAGSEAAFVELMNEKAREIGALDTRFANTHGLYHRNHYSTAADLARIACYAVRNPQFNDLCGTREWTMRRLMATKDLPIRNHNKLLRRYPGADGIKTGYVRQSGRCLVASATRQEGGGPWRLIAVVLNSKDTYADSAALLDYGFTRFQPLRFARRGEQVGTVKVRGGAPGEIPVIAQEDIYAVVPRAASGAPAERRLTLARLKAPVRRHQPVGTLSGLVAGRVQVAGALLAGEEARVDWTSSAARYGSLGAAGLMVFAWGPRYARALAKGPRRRRRRVPARRRSANPRRPRQRRRASGYGAWYEG